MNEPLNNIFSFLIISFFFLEENDIIKNTEWSKKI